MVVFNKWLGIEQINAILACNVLSPTGRVLYITLCNLSAGFGIECSISRKVIMNCLNFTDYRTLNTFINELVTNNLMRLLDDAGRYELGYELVDLNKVDIFDFSKLVIEDATDKEDKPKKKFKSLRPVLKSCGGPPNGVLIPTSSSGEKKTREKISHFTNHNSVPLDRWKSDQFISYYSEKIFEKYSVSPSVTSNHKTMMAKLIDQRKNNDHIKQLLDIYIENKGDYFRDKTLHLFVSSGMQDLLDNILRTGKYPDLKGEKKSTLFKAELLWDVEEELGGDKHDYYNALERRAKKEAEEEAKLEWLRGTGDRNRAAALASVENAETTNTQEDVDSSRLLVNALRTDYKISLIERLDVVEEKIKEKSHESV
jgi:hypothetical protein